MSDIKKQRLRKLAKFILVKLPLVFAVLAVMVIISLKLVTRYPDPLREGFEEYLSGAYHTKATIGKLEKVSFFPNVIIHATDVTMHNKSNVAMIDLSVKSFSFQVPLSAMLLQSGRIDKLEVKGLKSSSDFILPRSFNIDEMGIIDREGPDQYGSFIIAKGKYDDQPMVFEAEVKKLKNGYKVGKNIPFSLKIGRIEINAQIEKKSQSVKLKNTVFSVGNKSSEAQNYILFESNEFNENNPLYCILKKADVNECKIYLDKVKF